MSSTNKRNANLENIQAEGKPISPDEFKEILDSAPKVDLSKEQPIAEPIKPQTLIYCGPNLPKGILNQFTTYRNGLPKHLDGHLEKCSALKRLFVPVENLNSTTQAASVPGSSEHVWMQEVQAYIQGGAI